MKTLDFKTAALGAAAAVVEVAKKAAIAVVDSVAAPVPREANDEVKRRAEINARGDAIRAERAAVLDQVMGARRPWIRPARGWMARGR